MVSVSLIFVSEIIFYTKFEEHIDAPSKPKPRAYILMNSSSSKYVVSVNEPKVYIT